MRHRLLIAAFGLLTITGSASALPMMSGATAREGSAPVIMSDYRCGPGYHIGRGGQRCWPNGWAPAEEIPPGFVPPPRAEGMLPVLECPPGYHLGRGRQRCWSN